MFGIYEICSHNHPNDKDNKHYFYYEFHIVKLQKLSLKFKKNKRKRKAYKIDRSNNNFKMYAPINKLKFTASWFMDFGKSTSEAQEIENKILFTIVKKVPFRNRLSPSSTANPIPVKPPMKIEYI